MTTPAANNIWLTGETHRIQWENITPEGIDFPPTTHIRLRNLENASFVYNIADDVPTDKFHFDWKVPAELANLDTYYIRLLPQRQNPLRPDGTPMPNIVSSNSRPFLIVGGQGDCM